MSKFDQFKLQYQKAQDDKGKWHWYAVIPEKWEVFPGKKRYEYQDERIDVRLVGSRNELDIDANVQEIDFSDLSLSEMSHFEDYLKEQSEKENNVGFRWALFRMNARPTPVIMYGANVLSESEEDGQKQLTTLLTALERERTRRARMRSAKIGGILLLALLGIGALAYKFDLLGLAKKTGQTVIEPLLNRHNHQFYSTLFPDMYPGWFKDENPGRQKAAEMIFKSEYVDDLLRHTSQKFWPKFSSGQPYDDQAVQLVLFTYFNYNQTIKDAWKEYEADLQGTSFARLHNLYAQHEPQTTVIYTAGVEPITSQQFHTQAQKLRLDTNAKEQQYAFKPLAECEKELNASQQEMLKKIMTNLFPAMTPLKIEPPASSMKDAWFLVTVAGKSQTIEFMAFFEKTYYTPILNEVVEPLKNNTAMPDSPVKWYRVPDSVAQRLHLDENARKRSWTLENEVTRETVKLLSEMLPTLGLQDMSAPKVFQGDWESFIQEDQQGYCVKTSNPLTAISIPHVINEDYFNGDYFADKHKGKGIKPKKEATHLTVLGVSDTASETKALAIVDNIPPDIYNNFEQTPSLTVFQDGVQYDFTKLKDTPCAPYRFVTRKSGYTLVFYGIGPEKMTMALNLPDQQVCYEIADQKVTPLTSCVVEDLKCKSMKQPSQKECP